MGSIIQFFCHARLRGFRLSIAAVCLASPMLLALSNRSEAEPGFPNKPVRICIPFGPGGVGDITMRLLAEKLSERTKQQFVIENCPGPGGFSSGKAVLDTPADGYTLGVTGNSQAVGVSLFKTRPYNILADFTQISITASFEMLLAVKGASDLSSLSDVVATARKYPGKLNFGAISSGSTQNLSAHMFKQMNGLDVTIIPYKTTPALLTAILRGDVDVGFDYYAGLQAGLSDGKVRIVATSGEERNPLLADVPTARESGFPDYVVTSWNGLSAPAGLPADILKTLNVRINEALSDPDLRAKARRLGVEARGSTPEGMRARMVMDIQKWAEVIEKSGIERQ